MIATWLVQLIIRALGPNLLIDSYVMRKIRYVQASERLLQSAQCVACAKLTMHELHACIYGPTARTSDGWL
jgi:hypothetical protein